MNNAFFCELKEPQLLLIDGGNVIESIGQIGSGALVTGAGCKIVYTAATTTTASIVVGGVSVATGLVAVAGAVVAVAGVAVIGYGVYNLMN